MNIGLNIVIVDDEELAIEVLENMLSEQKGINIVGKYTDPNKALSELHNLDVDAIFLDLDMNQLHGLEFAEILYNNHKNKKLYL